MEPHFSSLERIRDVQDEELEPTLENQGSVPPSWATHAAWYITGNRDDGVPMCQALLFHWDELDHRWIEVGPQKPVADAGIVEQPTFGAPVAIALRKVRGNWSVKVRFFRK